MPDYLTVRVAGRGLHAYKTATKHRPKVRLHHEKSWLKGRHRERRVLVGLLLLVGRVCVSLTWRRWSPNQ